MCALTTFYIKNKNDQIGPIISKLGDSALVWLIHNFMLSKIKRKQKSSCGDSKLCNK